MKYFAISLAVLFFAAAPYDAAYSQQMPVMVSGSVTDIFGNPVKGAAIYDAAGTEVASSDYDGTFTVEAGDATYTVNADGFLDVTFNAGKEDKVEIMLRPDAARRDETVDFGYYTQKRNAVGGSVATVSGEELAKSPVAVFGQTLAGHLPGLITHETSSMPGAAVVNKYIRGVSSINGNQPVVIVDGLIMQEGNYEYITPNEIENVTVLKDASATAIYGIQGANGVIVITTRSGRVGGLDVSVSLDQSFQQMTTRPTRLNTVEYAALRNQAWKNDGSVGNAPFSDSQLAAIRSGSDPLYPDNDWRREFLKKIPMMQRIGVNVSGGGRTARYFSNINVMHQGAMFNTDSSQDQYNAAPNGLWINFRTKVDVNITRNLSAFVRISGNLSRDKYAGAGIDNSSLYATLLSMPPTLIGPRNEDGQITTMPLIQNPLYGSLNASGYALNVGFNSATHAGIEYDFGGALKGLGISAAAAFQTGNDRMQYVTQDYERYYYDYAQGQYMKLGSNINSFLTNSVSGTYQYNISYYGGITYNRAFGKHSVDVNGYSYFLTEQRSRVIPDIPAVGMPYVRHTVGVNAAYGYGDRYFAKFDLGYSGSDAFARRHRYIAVPSGSLAWVASNENFIKGSKWLTYLKLRASYGLSANDDFSQGDYRFLYKDYITVSGQERLIGNPGLHAETVATQNYGIDLTLFNSLSVTFDLFRRNTNSMLIDDNGLIPIYQGLPTDSFAKTNNGRLTNNGFELTVDYTKDFSRDFGISLSASYMQSRNRIVHTGELELPTGANGYAYRYRQTGYPVGQHFGYLVDKSNGSGYISNAAELAACTAMYEGGGIGTPRLGDLIYSDLNGDGIIDQRDSAPIGNGDIPLKQATLYMSARYKWFELSMLFQGVFGWYGPVGMFTETQTYGIYNDLHLKSWTAERFAAGEEIAFPALSYSAASTSALENDFNIANRSYLRLRNLTLAYNLPEKAANAIFLKKLQIAFNVQNLFTLSALETKSIDPEIGSITGIQPFRVYNIGLRISF